MKKKKSLLVKVAMTLLFAVLSSAGAWASEVVTVGTAGSYGHSLPIGAQNKYVLTQQVYTADEINHTAGKIWSLGFNTFNGGTSRHLSIYVTHTTNSDTYNYVPPTANDLYFSGDMYFAAGQWNTIDFDKAFQYNGSSNLLITICDDTGTNGDYSTLSNGYYNPGSTQTMYATNDEQAYEPMASNEATSFTTISNWKAQIQLTFTDLPAPSNLQAVSVGDISAQIQCSLRGDATAWNLQYRKIGASNWIVENNITSRSKIIENLESATQYEVQVQGIFTGNKKSDWTSSQTFTTNCCPQEEMVEIDYALRSENGWYNAAVQIVDAEKGVEVAYLKSPSSGQQKGSIALCNGRTYNVNWIFDENHEYNNSMLAFTLSYDNEDEIYTMGYGGAPEEDAQLTSFVVDGGNYDFKMPVDLMAYDETYQDVTLSWTQPDNARRWLVTYSKDSDFNPDEPDEDCIILAETNPFVLPELEENTTYYYAVRAIELENVNEAAARHLNTNRASKKVKILKNGKIKVKIRGEWVTKSVKKLSRSKIRKIIKSCDRYSRPKVVEYIAKWKEGDDASKLQVELQKPRGSETKYNILTKKVGSEGTELSVDDLKWRVLKGSSDGVKKWTSSVTSETTKDGFDNVIFISAKKGSEVMFTLSQGVTGAKLEPYTIGWVAYHLLGINNFEDIADATKVSNEQLKKALDENKRYEVRQTDSSKPVKVTAEANNDTEADGKEQTKATEDIGQDGVMYIRHNETSGGYLRVRDVVVTSPNNVKEWTSTALQEGQMKCTIENLSPGSTVLLKSEPVYNNGNTGLHSPIATISIPNRDVAPLPGTFSVGPGKTVNFSKGNLQGWRYEDDFSLASKQYTIKGTSNINEGYPADEVDLFCWSTPEDWYGTAFGYGNESETVVDRFRGPFVEWGESASTISLIGGGWQTLSSSEWSYVLSERENADNLKTVATVAETKGLVLLPDNWTAPSGVTLTSGGTYTDEQWTALEEAGAVFLPAAGKFTDGLSLDKVGSNGYYWSCTPSDVKTSTTVKDDAYMMSFDASSGVTATGVMSRRIGGAVRLVKCNELSVTTAESGFTTLVSNASLDLTSTEGLTGYYATYVDDGATTVTLTSISLVPANTPIVLKGNPSTTYRIKATVTTDTPPAGNLLKGSATENTELEAGTAYILSGGKFCKNAAGTMPAGKAYLPAVTLTSGARMLTIFIDGDATAIRSIDVEETPSRTGIYNLQGQRVKTPGKGLYIINGKKVIIK